MQNTTLLNRTIQTLFLIIFLFSTTNSFFAQSNKSENKTENETLNQISLEGFTEAITINGQPVLRIIIGKKGIGFTEVKYEKRDNEDALVFNVIKIPNSVGTFYVTKTTLTYVPSSESKHYFKIEKDKLKKFELEDHWRFGKDMSHVNLEFEGDSKPIGLAYNNQGSETRVNKENYFAANGFLFRAIKDFDSALAEFNKLTASVREIDEQEEEEFEDEEIETNEKYDRFKDRTVVSTSKMRIKGKKRSIRTYAEYDFAGKTQTKPENIILYFYGSATSPIFREDNLELNFLVDGKRVSIGKMDFVDEEKRKTIIRQTVSVSIPYETFNQIVNGKKVEFQIGNLEYTLTDEHLEAFRKFLSYKIEE